MLSPRCTEDGAPRLPDTCRAGRRPLPSVRRAERGTLRGDSSRTGSYQRKRHRNASTGPAAAGALAGLGCHLGFAGSLSAACSEASSLSRRRSRRSGRHEECRGSCFPRGTGQGSPHRGPATGRPGETRACGIAPVGSRPSAKCRSATFPAGRGPVAGDDGPEQLNRRYTRKLWELAATYRAGGCGRCGAEDLAQPA
jgi:hypothetical protein